MPAPPHVRTARATTLATENHLSQLLELLVNPLPHTLETRVRIQRIEHDFLPVIQPAPRSREALYASLVVEVGTVAQRPSQAGAIYARVSAAIMPVCGCVWSSGVEYVRFSFIQWT